MVHKSLLWKERLDVSDGSLANRTDFELHAVKVGKCRAAELLLPVPGVLSEHDVAVSAVTMLPYESGHRALHWVTDVVDVERVAVGPSVQVAGRREIARPKGRVERVTGSPFGGVP